MTAIGTGKKVLSLVAAGLHQRRFASFARVKSFSFALFSDFPDDAKKHLLLWQTMQEKI